MPVDDRGVSRSVLERWATLIGFASVTRVRQSLGREFSSETGQYRQPQGWAVPSLGPRTVTAVIRLPQVGHSGSVDRSFVDRSSVACDGVSLIVPLCGGGALEAGGSSVVRDVYIPSK